MTMSPATRKFALTAHVASSVGWAGAVAVFFLLSIAGLASADERLVRSAYIAMDVATRLVIVPLAITSVITGIVSSLGTVWGLFRYWWVLIKLVVTCLSTLVLVVHLQPISRLSAASAANIPLGSELHNPQVMMVAASGLALVVLLALTALSIYKLKGMTAYGWRKQFEQS